jgi:hypothetical protein
VWLGLRIQEVLKHAFKTRVFFRIGFLSHASTPPPDEDAPKIVAETAAIKRGIAEVILPWAKIETWMFLPLSDRFGFYLVRSRQRKNALAFCFAVLGLTNPPIGKALAFDALKRNSCAHRIVTAELGAV